MRWVTGNMIRGLARRLRNSQPLNYTMTTAVKAAFGPLGEPPEGLTKHLPRVGVVRSRLPNGRVLSLRSPGDEVVTSQVFWRGRSSYEPEAAPVFYEMARGASCVPDVGAHVRFYPLLAAHANPAGRVLAFEPPPEAVGRFRRNIAGNLLTNAELIECAVGGEVGTAAFFHAPDSSEGVPSSSGLAGGFFHPPYYVESGVTSEPGVTTIDEVVRDRNVPRVDLIKMDTETTGPAVLARAAGVLERDGPDLVFEVLPGRGTGPAITHQLKPLGHTFHLPGENGPEERAEVEGHRTLWNYLARVEGRGRA